MKVMRSRVMASQIMIVDHDTQTFMIDDHDS